MKKTLSITFIMSFMFLFSSCNNEDLKEYSEAPEKFTILMAVTNDAGKDLAFPTNNYETTGDYPKRYKFDAWSVYLDKKLIQSDKKEGQSQYCYKKTSYNANTNQLFIHLETDGWLQRQMDDWNKKHHAKYVIVSKELFGDTEEHIIDLEILGITDKVKQTFVIDFSVAVDGVEQTVYYPEFWEGLYPKDSNVNTHRPFFVLNVDAL